MLCLRVRVYVSVCVCINFINCFLGVQHGKLASKQIHGWLESAEMKELFSFVATPYGNRSFQLLQDVNSRAFPQYVEEMQGLAVGAGVELRSIWAINVLNELAALKKNATRHQDHCTDVYAVSSGGYGSGFSLGHNEDVRRINSCEHT